MKTAYDANQWTVKSVAKAEGWNGWIVVYQNPTASYRQIERPLKGTATTLVEALAQAEVESKLRRDDYGNVLK